MGGDAPPGASGLTGLVIRRARNADLAAVAHLEHVCYSDPWAASAFEQLTDNPRVHFVVAHGNDDGAGSILGYVVAWFVMDEGELANLAVAPESRRSGVARQLLDSVLDESRRRGIRDLFLEVRESNEAALGLYEGRGFERVGRREGYYRNPMEPAFILRRRLE